MRISVIIPAFNLEGYIGEAIDSVLAQSRAPDQIVVIDDGSVDRTASIVQSYEPSVQLIRMQQNSGVLPVILKGLEVVDGDIICFLDGDDVWLPRKLELVEKEFTACPSVMIVTHGYQCIDGQSKLLPYHSDDTHINMRTIYETSSCRSETTAMLKNSILCYKGFWLGSAWSIRRSALDLAAFRRFVSTFLFEGFTTLSHQDQPMAAFMVLDPANRNSHVGYINSVLFKYRLHGANTSGSFTSADSAARSALRALATVSATSHLVSQHPELIEANIRQQFAVRRATYLYALYTSKSLPLIVSLFIQAFPGIPRNRWMHEFTRLTIVSVLGLSNFIRLKKIFTRHR